MPEKDADLDEDKSIETEEEEVKVVGNLGSLFHFANG